MSSSSSSLTPPSFKHQVFISSYAEDTLLSFTYSLYSALLGKRISVFFDDELRRGNDIFPAVYKPIEDSRISVIVFSKSYAKFRWCLDELVHILECREKYNQIVITVYYDIDPLDVRNQTGAFADAFKEHEQCCEKSLVQRWRSALTESADLLDYVLQDIKLESQLIDKIVEDILERLNDMSLNLPENSHTIDIGEQESGDEDNEEIEEATRERTNQRMKTIQDLVPGGNKIITKSMLLDETSNYIQSLQRQVEFLSMKLSSAHSNHNPSNLFQSFQPDTEQLLPHIQEAMSMMRSNTATSSVTPSIGAHPTKYITTKQVFVATNFILEVPSAIFDQLSSKHKPLYALLSMVLSFMAMLICVTELVYQGGQQNVRWRWKKKIPWFYRSILIREEPFGTITDFIGLLCAILQCIFIAIDYASYLRNSDGPIKMSAWPLVFAFCLMCSNFSKHPHNKML